MNNEQIENLIVERWYADTDRRAAIEAELEADGIRLTDVEHGVRWERV